MTMFPNKWQDESNKHIELLQDAIKGLRAEIEIMKLEKQLFKECKSCDFNCSITYQITNDYSIEIYKGYKEDYKEDYKKVFYTDGHTKRKKAIKKALKFLDSLKVEVDPSK